jgi:excisionase family DNA binding protein
MSEGSIKPNPSFETTGSRLYMTVSEIAAFFGMPVSTVYRLVAGGLFPGVLKVGRSIRVPVSSVQAFVSEADRTAG